MRVNRFLHTAVLVSDLERAKYFYGRVLGLTEVGRPLKYPGVWYQIGDYQLHLIVEPNLKLIRQNKEKWGRNPHLALEVTNIDRAKRQLEASECPFQISASGRAALFTQDPDGNIIEITQLQQ